MLPLGLPIPGREHQRQCPHPTTRQPREKQAGNSRSQFKQGPPRNQSKEPTLNNKGKRPFYFKTFFSHNSSCSISMGNLLFSAHSRSWRSEVIPHCYTANIFKCLLLHYCFISQGENKKSLSKLPGAGSQHPPAAPTSSHNQSSGSKGFTCAYILKPHKNVNQAWSFTSQYRLSQRRGCSE